MCLAIPGEVLSVTEGDLASVGPAAGADLRAGRVSFGGLVKEVCLACVPEARVGDFVLVHAGFAIAVVSAEHAREVTAYLERIGEAAADAEPEAAREATPEGQR